MKVFEAIQTPDEKEWIIVMNNSLFNGTGMWGTGNVIASRLLGISYPNFLRWCRDSYNAEIRGKQGYSNVYFKSYKDAANVVDKINKEYKKIEDIVCKTGLRERKLEYSEYKTSDRLGVYYVDWRVGE